jgi:hypothetical protein
MKEVRMIKDLRVLSRVLIESNGNVQRAIDTAALDQDRIARACNFSE